MPEVMIYVTPICPYCIRAKALLDKLGIPYQVVDVTEDPSLRDEMIRRSNGRTTVPQIFINEVHIGGYDDLYALYKAGKLDSYLNRT